MHVCLCVYVHTIVNCGSQTILFIKYVIGIKQKNNNYIKTNKEALWVKQTFFQTRHAIRLDETLRELCFLNGKGNMDAERTYIHNWRFAYIE